jgi:hypothetical protein
LPSRFVRPRRRFRYPFVAPPRCAARVSAANELAASGAVSRSSLQIPCKIFAATYASARAVALCVFARSSPQRRRSPICWAIGVSCRRGPDCASGSGSR